VFTKLAAVTGLAAKGILDTGSGVLNAAAQFSVLAVNIQNAKGFTNLFKSSLEFLGAPFKAVGTMAAGFVTNLFGIGASSGIAAAGTGTLGAAGAASAGGIGAAAGATGAFAASLWAAAWPILAVVGAVALVAAGVYLLIQNWDAVSGFFVSLWQKVTGVFSAAWNWIKNVFNETPNWVLGLVAVFFPFIGIPLLVIKNWNAIPAFFTGLWQTITATFAAAWEWIKNVFIGLPNWVVGLVAAFFPFIGIPLLIIKNWGAITGFFTSLWEGIKSGIADFLGWISPVIEKVTGFFKFIGKSIGGSAAGSWFSDTVDVGKSAIAEMELSKNVTPELNQNITRTVTSGTALTDIGPLPAETVTAAVAVPSFAEPAVPLPDFAGSPAINTAPEFSSAVTVPAPETLTGFTAARASAPDLTFTASSAFSDALSGVSGTALPPAFDPAAIDEEIGRNFVAAMPQQNVNLTLPWRREQPARQEKASYTMHVNTVNINNEDIERAFDLMRILFQSVHKPEEEAV
jgi:hypothetical protein